MIHLLFLATCPLSPPKRPKPQRVFINCDVSWRKRHGENNHQSLYRPSVNHKCQQKISIFFQAFDLHLVGFRTNTFLLLNGFSLLESSDLQHFFPFSFAGWSQVYNWKLKMRRGNKLWCHVFFCDKKLVLPTNRDLELKTKTISPT